MAAIAGFTEESLDYARILRETLPQGALSLTDALCQGVGEIATDLSAAAVLCATTSGETARMISRMRLRMPVIAATSSLRTYRRLPLYWGVRPLLVPPSLTTDEELHNTLRAALEAGWIRAGETVVLTLGSPVRTAGETNLIKVQRV
jgi:pyruvate kinase